MARASTRNSAPASVSSTPRPTRWNNFAPSRFQRRYRCADGGLGQIEHCRSARDVLTFGNSDEYP
jgi:hypothetical protein